MCSTLPAFRKSRLLKTAWFSVWRSAPARATEASVRVAASGE